MAVRRAACMIGEWLLRAVAVVALVSVFRPAVAMANLQQSDGEARYSGFEGDFVTGAVGDIDIEDSEAPPWPD